MPEPLSIWVMSDGRAGNVAQALGLAEAVARCSPARIERQDLELRRLAALMPPRLWQVAATGLPGWPEAGLSRRAEAPRPPWPDLAIGAGRRAAPFVASLRARHGVKAVQILDPQMPPTAFDLVAAPSHDGLSAPNAVPTLGAIGRVTPGLVAGAAARLAPSLAHLPRRRVAVLIGGSGKAARWAADDAARLARMLADLAASGFALLATTSRRTDPATVAALRAALSPFPGLLHTGEGENPYPGILGLAEAVVVTEDSVNMASEAASTGLPLHVFRVGRPSAKARAFHAELAARGIARDFEGVIGHWDYPPLAEADRVARIVLDRLFPERGMTAP